jgi:hypothetical protein
MLLTHLNVVVCLGWAVGTIPDTPGEHKELSIKTKRFELTCGLIDLYIRIGSWEAYWNALRPFTIW